MDRPVTSKPRGICCYYKTERGCFAKDRCKFLHGDPDREPGPLLTPYDKAKTCRYYAAGFCTRGNKCWFLHVSPDPAASGPTTIKREPEDDSCSICFEKPPTYGLLSNCSHVFCIDCIRQWRDPKGKTGDVVESGNTKKCPMCRIPSKYIIPSARFYPEGTEGKLLIEKKYRESTAKIKCRYFEQSKRDPCSPVLCPFGKDCFYKHINSDGTPHIFSDGVDVSMRNYSNRDRGSSDPMWTFGSLFLIPDHYPTSSRINPGNGNSPRRTTTAEESGARFARSLEMLSTAISNNSRLQDLEQTVEAMRSRLETWSAMRGELRNAGIADDEILENIHAVDTTNAEDSGRSTGPDILGDLETMIESHGINDGAQDVSDRESRRTLLRDDGEVIDRLNNLADYILAAVSSLSPSDNNEPPPVIDFGSTDDVSDMPALELPSDSEDDYPSEDDNDWTSSGTEIHSRVEMDLRDLFPVPSRPLVSTNEAGHSAPPAPTTETSPIWSQPDEDAPSASMQDPPFLTDGRGRVVWSSASITTNCDAGAVAVPNAEENSDDLVDTTNDEGEDTDGEESDSSINPFTLLSRMFGAFFF